MTNLYEDYRIVTYYDVKIYWNINSDGFGETMIDDFLNATSFITQDRNFNHALEWCSGPGYWGFGLLGTHKVKKLTLSDIYEPVKGPIAKTISENNYQEKAQFIVSDNFKNIPKQSFDLIVSNPPHFDIDPVLIHPNVEKYKDKGWKIHENFFNNVNEYLADDGIIILAENIHGSNVDTFRSMIEKNNLQITHHFNSQQGSDNSMWYLAIAKNPA
jgi:methylase of polypeptide subunit release factors